MSDHPPRDQRLGARMRADADAKASRDGAVRTVKRWNAAVAAGHGTSWSPTLRCAVLAERPWLEVFCPGCGTSRAFDIRTVRRHALATVGGLVIGLKCSLCPGRAPMAELRGLHASPPAAKDESTL